MTGSVRMERDTFGEIAVPADRLWGAQTQRSLQNFRISTEKQSPELIRALATVKRAAATVNAGLGQLEPTRPRPSRRPPTRCWPASTMENSRWLSGRPVRAPRPT